MDTPLSVCLSVCLWGVPESGGPVFMKVPGQAARATSSGQGLDGRFVPEALSATRHRLGAINDALLLDQRLDNSLAEHLAGARPDPPCWTSLPMAPTPLPVECLA
jgi:hypothetical protein